MNRKVHHIYIYMYIYMYSYIFIVYICIRISSLYMYVHIFSLYIHIHIYSPNSKVWGSLLQEGNAPDWMGGRGSGLGARRPAGCWRPWWHASPAERMGSDTKLPSHLLMQPEATGLFFGMECSKNMSEVGPCYAMTNTTLLDTFRKQCVKCRYAKMKVSVQGQKRVWRAGETDECMRALAKSLVGAAEACCAMQSSGRGHGVKHT